MGISTADVGLGLAGCARRWQLSDGAAGPEAKQWWSEAATAAPVHTLLLAGVQGPGWSPCPPGSGRVSGWFALSSALLWVRQVGFSL